MDAIDARIESLKKEVANLEAHHKHLLSRVASPSRFRNQTLIKRNFINIVFAERILQ